MRGLCGLNSQSHTIGKRTRRKGEGFTGLRGGEKPRFHDQATTFSSFTRGAKGGNEKR